MKVFTRNSNGVKNRKTIFLQTFLSMFLLGMMIIAPSVTKAQFWSENFTYNSNTATALTASGNWNAHSGAGTNPITTGGTGLTYAGHPGSGVGLAVTMATSGEDDNRAFTSTNSGTVYVSLLINVATASAAGDYCAGLYVNTSTFATKLHIKTNGAGFNFGIIKNTGAVTYESTVRTFGTTYLVVMSYTFNASTTDDIAKLFVNPALGAAEPAATISLGAGVADNTAVAGFYLRQGTAASASTQTIDAIITGTTWAQVTPISGIPVVSGASLSGTVGTAFPTFTVSATNSPTSYAIASGSLPGGISLTTGPGAGAGDITGTPTAAGSFTANINATNGAGTSASPGAINITIAMGNQTITGLPLTDTRTYTAAVQQYNLAATTNSGLTISYGSDNNAVASVIGNQVTINGAGIAHITASQLGDANWNAATSVQQTLTVNQASQLITFGSLGSVNDVDPNFQLTATGGGSGNQVTYVSSNTAVATIVNAIGNIDPNGTYVDIVGPGTTTITASQAGNTNYSAAAPVGQLLTVINTSLINQSITFNPLLNKTYGDANFQLTATGGGSGNQVTYASSNTAVATIVDALGNLDPNGSYVKIIAPGSTNITANQAGNGTYNAAPPVVQPFTVDVKPLTVSNAVADNKVYDGGTAATISGATLNGVINSDVVNINGFGGTFADPNVNNGIAVTAALTINGAGAVKYSLVQPTGLSANITKATQTINFAALPNKSPGDPNFNLTATAVPSGATVTYTSSDPTVATVTTAGLVHIVAIGSTTMTASAAATQNYFAATPVPQTQTVVAATPGSIFANTIADANPSATNPYVTGQTLNGNITVGGIARGTGITASAASGRYSAADWTLTASPDANDYFEFTLTPNAGYKIDFFNLVFSHQRSGTGPVTYDLRSSVNNYATSIASGATPASAATATLSLSSFTNISSQIKFRLYAYGATATGGTYSVNDFIFNGNVTLTPPTATFVKTNVSACSGNNDGTITVTASGTGPFSYAWTGVTGSGNPATTPYPNPGNVSALTGLPIGYYNVTITDANLNTTTITGIHIEKAFTVVVSNSGSISSACGNTGTITLYGNAGVQPYTFSLNGTTYQAGNTFSNLAAGSYTGYIKDAAGCVGTKSISVTAAAPIVVSPFVRNASACGNDGSIEVYRSGGIPPYTYSKDGTNYQASNVFSALAAGSYTVYVKDSKGCVASQAATVTQGAALTVTANKTNSSTCVADGTIQLNGSGGVGPYTYSLDDVTYQPGNSFTGLSANNYTGWVKDSKGCKGSVNVNIGLNTISVTAYAGAASSCASSNGVIQLFRTGGVGPYMYSLDGNTYQASNTFTGLTPNYYEGFVQDSKGCIGHIIDIYIGPDCGQRGVPTARSNSGNNVKVLVTNSSLKVQAYPNPSATEFILNLEGYGTDKVSITVTDVMGRTIFHAEGNAKQQYKFGNGFQAGLYNVQVIQGNDKKTIRLVKE